MALTNIPFDSADAGKNLTSSSQLRYDNATETLMVGDGATADASAALYLNTVTQGFGMIPITTSERDAISSPVGGLIINNADTNSLEIFDGAVWNIVEAIHQAETISIDAEGIWATPHTFEILANLTDYSSAGTWPKVTLSFSSVLETANTSDVITFSANLPSDYFPAVDLNFTVQSCVDNGVNKIGNLFIDTAGQLVISLVTVSGSNLTYPGNFTGSGTSGFRPFVISYNLAAS